MTSSISGKRHEGRRGDVDALGSFTAALPISDAAMARAHLAACAMGIVTTYLIWLAVFAAVLLAILAMPGRHPLWPTNVGWQVLPMLAGAAWIIASNIMTMVCTGCARLWLIWIGSIAMIYCTGLAVLFAFTHQSVVQATMSMVWVLLATAVVACTLVCYWLAWRRRFISLKSVGAACAVSLVVFWLATGLQREALSAHWPEIAVSSLLFILPWAAMPLAISHNRHGR